MLTLDSSAFLDGGRIPVEHTCQGADLSPHLRWKGGDESCVSYAIIVDDPDAPDPAAPKMVFVHWVVYNIPGGVSELSKDADLKSLGALEGLNGWNEVGYRGPCPPIGDHRYFFKLYALDTELNLKSGATKEELFEAMKEHIIEQAEIIGRYSKE